MMLLIDNWHLDTAIDALITVKRVALQVRMYVLSYQAFAHTHTHTHITCRPSAPSYSYASKCTRTHIRNALFTILDDRFHGFHRPFGSKLVLKTVERCFMDLNYCGNGSMYGAIKHFYTHTCGASTPSHTYASNCTHRCTVSHTNTNTSTGPGHPHTHLYIVPDVRASIHTLTHIQTHPQGFDTLTHLRIIADMCERSPHLWVEFTVVAVVWTLHSVACQVTGKSTATLFVEFFKKAMVGTHTSEYIVSCMCAMVSTVTSTTLLMEVFRKSWWQDM
jgi:hypothetical protein